MLPLTFNNLLVDSIFDNWSHNDDLLPRDRIYKLDGMFEIKLDLPGVKREDIKVALDDRKLTVECERKDHFKSKYKKTYAVGNQIDVANIESYLAEGVLCIKLPVLETSKTRHIAVK